METSITYRTDLADVDWERLKEALSLDQFDNGRSAEQLRISFENTRFVVLALACEAIVGTARALSDGVCNAYIVDVWTQSDFRRQGIGSRMMHMLLDQLPGQHVSLFTEEYEAFYEQLGFREESTGFSLVVGTWLQGD